MSRPGEPRERGALAWMAKNGVASNLLMLVLIVGGLIMAPRVQQEVFPEVTLDLVTVTVPYPGASPEEVEEGVVLAIEDAVRGLDGVKEVSSTAAEGQGVVIVELLTGANDQQVRAEVESAVDRITSFPRDAERPVVNLATNRQQVISLIIHGDVSDTTLRQQAEKVRADLLRDGRITQAEVTGLPPPEISIEIPREKLRAHDLTLLQVAQRAADASIDLPGGRLDTPGGEVLVRTTERRERGEAFEQVAVISQPGGEEVTVADLGTVIDGFQDTDRAAFFNGEPAVEIDVYRVGDQKPVEVATAVREYVEEHRDELPEGLEYALWNDQSRIFDDRINLLLDNAYLGVGLVVLLLGLFLQPRVAFWVTLGIPISFLGAFLFLPALDVSINMISLFAFILTLGIVVDDAIVVGEAIHKHQEDGEPPMRAAIMGAREVKGPVIFAVLTTIMAFMPMLFIPGVAGKFFRNIPLVVIPILTLSLVEAFFVLPHHLGKTGQGRGFLGRIRRAQERFGAWFDGVIERHCRPAIDAIIRNRYLTLAGGFALLTAVGGYVASGRIPFTFLPRVESDVVTVSVRMPVGTPAERTRQVIDRIIGAAEASDDRLTRDTIARGIYADLGVTAAMQEGGPEAAATGGGGHLAQVSVALVPASERTIGARRFTEVWREETGDIPGVESTDFEYGIGGAAGPPVAIELAHDDIDVLRTAATELAEQLSDYAGVFDVDSGFEEGKEQIDLTLRPGARALGVDETLLARQVRAAFYGAEVERQQRDREELRIYVRLPEEERQSEYAIESFLVQVPEGGEIPLDQAADLEFGAAPTAIERRSGRRVITVTGDVDTDVATGGEVTDDLASTALPELQQKYPDLAWSPGGEQEEQLESLDALRLGMGIALLAMFALMAVAFRSYIQPIIVLLAIPFGTVGAIGGHLLLGYGLSLISLLGMIALGGVVVNDSLVLISAINDRRRGGCDAHDAVVSGARRRFRPILLTSLTTFGGLAPMIFETSVQARFLIPMAISLGFGVLFVTVITLVLVPSAYMAVEDAKGLGARLRARLGRGGNDDGDGEVSGSGEPGAGAESTGPGSRPR